MTTPSTSVVRRSWTRRCSTTRQPAGIRRAAERRFWAAVQVGFPGSPTARPYGTFEGPPLNPRLRWGRGFLCQVRERGLRSQGRSGHQRPRKQLSVVSSDALSEKHRQDMLSVLWKCRQTKLEIPGPPNHRQHALCDGWAKENHRQRELPVARRSGGFSRPRRSVAGGPYEKSSGLRFSTKSWKALISCSSVSFLTFWKSGMVAVSRTSSRT